MCGCDPVMFQNVNQSVFDCIKKKLSDAGTSVPPGNSGRMTGWDLRLILAGMARQIS